MSAFIECKSGDVFECFAEGAEFSKVFSKHLITLCAIPQEPFLSISAESDAEEIVQDFLNNSREWIHKWLEQQTGVPLDGDEDAFVLLEFGFYV